MARFDFTSELIAQDMISKLCRETGAPPETAIAHAINAATYHRAATLQKTKACVLYGRWKATERLRNPVMEVSLTQLQEDIIASTAGVHCVSNERAVGYMVMYRLKDCGFNTEKERSFESKDSEI